LCRNKIDSSCGFQASTPALQITVRATLRQAEATPLATPSKKTDNEEQQQKKFSLAEFALESLWRIDYRIRRKGIYTLYQHVSYIASKVSVPQQVE